MNINYKLFTASLIALSIRAMNAQCPIPTSVTASPSVICAGVTTTLNATATGAFINWYTTPSGGSTIGSSLSGANFTINPAVTTTYYAESFSVPTVTLNYTGAVQTYTVPAGVTTLTVDIRGAKGGNGFPFVSQGGKGGRVTGTISVVPGQVLNVFVGGIGANGTSSSFAIGGFNGGGNSGYYSGSYGGGGGGGASDIRISPYGLSDRIVVAGGGGGGAYNSSTSDYDRGGNGGGTIGEAGFSGNVTGGTATGGGGSQVSGGSSGFWSGYCTASIGVIGVGGAGGTCSNSGGGGGGGYFGGGGGVWAGGGGGSNYLVGGIHTQGFQTGNGQVMITSVNCISASRTPITVTVNPIPTVSVTNGSICSGNSFTISPSGASTYTFSSGSAIVTPSVTMSYSVTGTSSAGCVSSNTAVSTVTVNTVPTVTTSASSSTICAGQSVSLMALSSVGSYTWNTGATTSITPMPTLTTVYTASATSAEGCIGSSMITVTVNPNPTIIASASNANICIGETTILTVSTSATSYTWNTGSTTSITPMPLLTTVYTASATSTEGCIGTSVVTVTVNSNPTISASASNTTICIGETAVLTVSTSATSYTWNTGATTISTSVSPTVTTVYTASATSVEGCKATSTVAINVNPKPTISVNASNTNICIGEASVLTVSTSATSYTWNTGATTTSISVSPTVTTNYTISGTDSNGCTNLANLNIIVNACTGIQELTSSLISVFPNPNNGILNITLSNAIVQNSSLEIYDAIGNLVVKQNLINEFNEINISNLNIGIYTFKVVNNNITVKIGKLIRQ